MADNYAVLHGKYQRALVTIRELTQERNRAEKQLADLRDANVQVEKSVKYLCETIMKKDRSRKDEKTWFRMSLTDMIATAQTSIENYFPSIETMIQKLLANNAERTEKIARLELEAEKAEAKHRKEMEDLTALKDGVIAKLTEKLKTGRMEEGEIEKIVKKGESKKPKIDMPVSGEVEFEAEDSDAMDAQVADAAEAMYEAGELIVPAKHGPRVKNTPKTKEAVKEKVKKIEERQGAKVSKYASGLTDPQKLLIRVMGETGYSELDPILKAAKEAYPELKSESSLKASMHGLMQDSDEIGGGCAVSSVKTPIPGSPNFCIYELSDAGRDVYSYLFGKEAKESEASLIRKAHTTLEHGYGIRRTAQLIMEMPYIKDLNAQVEYMTRDKSHTVKTGPNSAYIPDIVIVIEKGGKTAKRYIEYETGKCSDTDFSAKCTKIASFSKYINIVVPKNEAKEEVIRRIEKWREEITSEGATFPREEQVRVRISTYIELRDSLKNGEAVKKFPWMWEKTISPPKKGKG